MRKNSVPSKANKSSRDPLVFKTKRLFPNDAAHAYLDYTVGTGTDLPLNFSVPRKVAEGGCPARATSCTARTRTTIEC